MNPGRRRPGPRAFRLGLAHAAFLLALAAGAVPVSASVVPSPADVLGFEPGSERRLADWTQIAAYFRRLAETSARVRVDEVGRTTLGRPFLVVTLTSAENMARLEEIRATNLRLADPRRLTSEETEGLVARGKTVVALHHGIHSTEVGPSQASLLTAHWLASSEAPEVREILDRCVVLLLPSHNPDGTDRVVEWYRASLGQPWEGGAVPFLYHPYAGHDNNRDWYAFNLAESRLTVAHVYDRWRPQIVHDLHQMDARGARIFLPPYTDPYEPNVDPALVGAVSALGTHVAAQLLSDGKTGVVTGALFDGYSPARAYPHTHGGVRILSEVASARMATALETPFAELRTSRGFDPQRASANFPRPWPGGRWTLRDVVDYEADATRALLQHAAGQREFWLRTFTGVLRRAAERTDLYAFVLPGPGRDPYTLFRLVDILRTGGVEVDRARAPFRAEVDGRTAEFEAGSYVVRMKQPFSAFAKQMLERQAYPDRREYPGGPPVRPYDVTAHTLPLLLGVEAHAVVSPFSAELEPVGEARPARSRLEGALERGGYFALGHRTGDLVGLARLQRAGVAVRWTAEPFTDGGRSFPAGTLLVPARARSVLAPVVEDLGLVARAVRARARGFDLRRPRLGLYQSWVASMDEGWTRFVLERQVGLPFETLHDTDVNRGGLRTRFDAILLPGQTAAQLLNGHAPGSLPDAYTGGLGRSGAARLREFVEAGGTLVALDGASLFAAAELALPVEPATAGQPDFYCPGALLNTRVEGASPLTHGLDPEVPVWFESSPVLDLRPAAPGATSVALRFASRDLLASGYLLGEAHLAGRPALVDVRLGKGRVVLFAFRPQYRGQSWATYVPFLNALYLSAATPAR